ncbi:UNVERIFIED_CONTAM: hypothetical protein HDU68_009672 [Siphonaria sp. JEL0065]|nr:hypothetical protein HDU68_009672 [Siphonaria sp. JEL0065]
MGNNVQKIANQILPAMFATLKSNDSDAVTVVTFHTSSEIHHTTVGGLSKLPLYSRGGTSMTPEIKNLEKVIGEMYANGSDRVLRLLTVSDGEIFDQSAALAQASVLADWVKNQNIEVNSQAVRFLSSKYAQPDMHALCSLLQLNNAVATAVDVSSILDFQLAVSKFANLFASTTQRFVATLKYESNLKLDGESGSIQLIVHDVSELSSQAYETLLYDKLTTFINKIKVLKIVNTQESLTSVTTIRDCFVGLQQDFRRRDLTAQENSTPESRNGLANRVKLLRERSRSVLQQLLQIANDDKLRGRRSMQAHLDELKDVDDSNHEKSFFSWDTTLGGIKTVCQLVEDNLVEEASANEIVELLNIVCTASVGNFPDSMSYRVSDILFGSFVSLSDILTYQLQSNGETIRMPGIKVEIINTIPMFEDVRIAKFYWKYAPKLLEFTCSIGMRRLPMVVCIYYSCGFLAHDGID